MDQEEFYQRSIDYLNGQLNEDERESLHNELKGNPELLERFDAMRIEQYLAGELVESELQLC